MDKPATLLRWWAGARALGRTTRDDPADHGTAFGLDLSLSELEADATMAPEANQPKPGWVTRMMARRKPVA